MTYKGDRSRVTNHQAYRDTWERCFGTNKKGGSMREDIEKKVIAAMKSVSGDIKNMEITEETKLEEDIFLDSLEQIDLIVDLESEFDIDVDDEDLLKAETVKDIVDLLEKLVEEKNG